MFKHWSLAVVFVAASLAACGGAPTPPSSARPKPTGAASTAAEKPASTPVAVSAKPAGSTAPTTAEKPERERIKLVYATASGEDTFVELAAQKNMFQKYGLTAEVSYAQSNTTVAALTSGEAQIAMADGVSAISAIAAGTPMKIIGYFDKTSPYMVVGLPEIKTMADFKGKTVAISRVGDTSDVSLRIALKSSGLNPGKDFTLLQVGNSPARWAALSSKQVQGAILDEEAYRRPAEAAGMNILVSLKQQKLPYVASALMIIDTFGKQNPNTVVAAIRGLLDAVAYFSDSKNKTEVMALMAKLLKMSPDDPQLTETYEAYYTRPAEDPFPDKAGIETILDAFKNIDAERYSKITSDQVVDASYLSKARAAPASRG